MERWQTFDRAGEQKNAVGDHSGYGVVRKEMGKLAMASDAMHRLNPCVGVAGANRAMTSTWPTVSVATLPSVVASAGAGESG